MLAFTVAALISELLRSSPTGSFPKQLIIKKKVPQAMRTPIIMYPRREPSEPEVIRNINEQKISKMPRPFVVFKNRKCLRMMAKSQNDITIKKPKKLKQRES